MNRILLLVLLLGLALSACRGSDAREPRSPENFEVISEGSASGVTSTLGGGSVNSMTSTDADTTSAFSILQQPTVTDSTGTTLSDQLPTTTTATPLGGGISPAPVPNTRPIIEITRSTPPATSTQPPRATTPQPPTPRPAPPPTTTQPAPEPSPTETEQAPSDEQSEEAPADESEEGEEEAPPPPTNT